MGSLKESVLNCSITAHDDDTFINELNKLAGESGEDTYSVIIQTLTSLDLEPEEAKRCWFEILSHRESISTALDRKISLLTTISDYFYAIETPLKNPKIVDIKVYEKVIKQSTHDSLTGLFNKAYLTDALTQHISLAKRHNTELSVLFLDIDNFKDINDTFGHHSGDLVLKNVAHRISQEMRASDIIARFGGDEFVILMPNTYKTNALMLSERLRNALNQNSIPIKGTAHTITVSGGVASFPADARKAENLLNLADSALYRAKGAGKNSISLFKEDKRRFLRIDFHRPVKVKHLGFSRTKTLAGKSKNIAVGGILFENKEPLSIGARVQVSISIIDGSDPLLLIGTIVRVEVLGPQSYDIGMILSFKEMEKTAKDEISKFLLQKIEENSD